MAWWIPVAMAAGGYAIDKKMGGNGLKGAMLGGSLGYGSGAGAAGAGKGGAGTAAELTAAEVAGSTIPAHLTTAGGLGASEAIVTPQLAEFAASNPTAGLTGETMSMFTPDGIIRGGGEFGMGGATNMFNNPISGQTADAALSGNNGLLSDTGNFIKDEYDNMSLMDKVQSGMLVDKAVSPEDEQFQEQQVTPLARKELPNIPSMLTSRIQDDRINQEDERFGLLASKYPTFT